MPSPRTVGQHIRDLHKDALIHLAQVLLPMLQRAWFGHGHRPRPAGAPEGGGEGYGRARRRRQQELRRHLVAAGTSWCAVHGTRPYPSPPTGSRVGAGASIPDPPDAGAEDQNQYSQLRVADGPRHGLNQGRTPACTEGAHDGPEPISLIRISIHDGWAGSLCSIVFGPDCIDGIQHRVPTATDGSDQVQRE